MTRLTTRLAFIALHLTLALVILVDSAHTLVHALRDPADHLHLGTLAAIETIAVLLFLWPGTLRIGGIALVAILLVAAVAHALQGDFPGPLLVYAVGVLFVTVHGSWWGHESAERRPV